LISPKCANTWNLRAGKQRALVAKHFDISENFVDTGCSSGKWETRCKYILGVKHPEKEEFIEKDRDWRALHELHDVSCELPVFLKLPFRKYLEKLTVLQS